MDLVTWLLYGASAAIIVVLVGGVALMVFGAMRDGPRPPGEGR